MDHNLEMNFDILLPDHGVSYFSDKRELQSGEEQTILLSRLERETTSTATTESKMLKRKKAVEACHCCRRRKIHCTLLSHEVPCAQCRMSGIKCVFSRNTMHEQLIQAQFSSYRTPATSVTSSDEYDATRVSPWAPSSVHMLERTPTCQYQIRYHEGGNSPQIYQRFMEQKNMESSAMVADARVATSLYLTSITHDQSPKSPISISSDSTSTSRDNFTLHPPAYIYSSRRVAVPSYFYSVPDRIGKKDLEYLQKKGVFSLPEARLRNQLLEAYIEFVHGHIPVLELNDFVSIVHNEGSGGRKLSLLLFNAVMFAGSTCIKLMHLQEAGFATREQGRRFFWQKTRLLYDFDYENNQICIIQTLLLMTFWYDSLSRSKGARYWSSIAVDLALTIGLNNDSVLQRMDVKQRKLCKRIWWSCLTRDQLVALGTRQPAFIMQDKHDVPVLVPEDFDIEDLSRIMPTISEKCVIARDLDGQKQVAMLFILQTKLCLCIRNVLEVRNSTSNKPLHGETSQQDQMAAMKQAPIDGNERCDMELKAWLLDLPSPAIYRPPMELFDCSETVVVHLSLLHILYHAAISTLHRPWQTHSSHAKARSAAHSITGILENLRCLNLARCIPIISLTFIAPALIIHLVDRKSPDEVIRHCAMEAFAKYTRIARELYEEHGNDDDDGDGDEDKDSCPSTIRLEYPATLSSVTTSKNQSGEERLQALNPRCRAKFYNITDETNALLPPDLQLVRRPESPSGTQCAQSSGQRGSLLPLEFTGMRDTLENVSKLDVSFDVPFALDYSEFLEDSIFQSEQS